MTNNHDVNGRFKVGNKANPQGKGGFGDHPEHIQPTRSLTPRYWRKKFGEMTEEQLLEVMKNSADLPAAALLVLEDFKAMLSKKVSTRDAANIRQDFYDRVDGKAPLQVKADVETTQREPLQIVFTDLSEG